MPMMLRMTFCGEGWLGRTPSGDQVATYVAVGDVEGAVSEVCSSRLQEDSHETVVPAIQSAGQNGIDVDKAYNGNARPMKARTKCEN